MKRFWSCVGRSAIRREGQQVILEPRKDRRKGEQDRKKKKRNPVGSDKIISKRFKKEEKQKNALVF